MSPLRVKSCVLGPSFACAQALGKPALRRAAHVSKIMSLALAPGLARRRRRERQFSERQDTPSCHELIMRNSYRRSHDLFGDIILDGTGRSGWVLAASMSKIKSGAHTLRYLRNTNAPKTSRTMRMKIKIPTKLFPDALNILDPVKCYFLSMIGLDASGFAILPSAWSKTAGSLLASTSRASSRMRLARSASVIARFLRGIARPSFNIDPVHEHFDLFPGIGLRPGKTQARAYGFSRATFSRIGFHVACCESV